MRIILVDDRPNSSRSVALSRRLTGLVPFAALLLLLLAGAAGYGLAVARTTQLPGDLVSAWRTELDGLAQQTAEARHSTELDGRAYAARIAALQARLLRMEAVGQRLATAAKLDDGEFDFDNEPALGGPLSAEAAEPGESELTSALDRLAAQIEDRERQLEVMGSLLVNRDLVGEVAISGKPVASGYVSSVFGRRTDPFSGKTAFHKGIDFTARAGTEVLAVASGVVTWAGYDKDYGKLVELRHTDGYRSRYAHNSALLVSPGDVVKKGQAIARVGRTGRASGTHLHLEVLEQGKLVDPLKYISGTRRRG